VAGIDEKLRRATRTIAEGRTFFKADNLAKLKPLTRSGAEARQFERHVAAVIRLVQA
jgi:hypothetical protein